MNVLTDPPILAITLQSYIYAAMRSTLGAAFQPAVQDNKVFSIGERFEHTTLKSKPSTGRHPKQPTLPPELRPAVVYSWQWRQAVGFDGSFNVERWAYWLKPRLEVIERSCCKAHEIVTALQLVTYKVDAPDSAAGDDRFNIVEIPLHLRAPIVSENVHYSDNVPVNELVRIACDFLVSGELPNEEIMQVVQNSTWGLQLSTT